MRARRRVAAFLILCPLSFVLFLLGCGLSDYGGQMASEKARLDLWDEETALLGPPIRMPELPKKDGKAQEWEVFLRVPRGVDPSPLTQQNSSLAQLFGGMLAQYVGGGKSGVLNLYLAWALEPKNFISTVVSHFPVSGGEDKTITIPRSVILLGTAKNLTPDIPLTRRVPPPGQMSAYSFYFYRYDDVDGKRTEVAVVYETELGAKADAAIKASLASLGGGWETSPLRKQYEKTNQKQKK